MVWWNENGVILLITMFRKETYGGVMGPDKKINMSYLFGRISILSMFRWIRISSNELAISSNG